MRSVFIIGLISLCGVGGDTAIAQVTTSTTPRFYVYRDGDSKYNNGFWTNFMPSPEEFPGSDEILEHSEVHKIDPNTGASCVRIDVKKWVRPRWAGIAVSCKPDYWGKKPNDRAFDLRRMKKLVFFAKGDRGGESIQIQVAILGKERYGDSARQPATSKWIELGKGWKKYELDVSKLDLSRVVTPFCVVTNKAHNDSDNFTFYLDDIYFE